MKKYSKYKNCNVEWVDRIPTIWDEIKVKHIFNERSQKGFPNETLLSATQSKGVIPQKSFAQRTVIATKDFENLKLVIKGDFVISLRSFQGGIEISYSRGIISPAYTVMFPSKQISKIYFKHLFKSIGLIQLLTTCVKGIREGQNIDYKMFKNKFMPLPPLPTQNRIAEYLDRKQQQANNFIAKRQKMIELLKEQKKAIINKAVTKGLNPNVKMKDSGVEWLGDIPEHWEVSKAKFICSNIGDGIHSTPIYSDNSKFYFINGNNLKEGKIIFPDKTRTVNEREYNKYFINFSKNTILISINGSVGNMAFFGGEKIILGKSAAYLNFKNGVNVYYFYYFIQSFNILNYFADGLFGTTISNLSLDRLRKTPLMKPSFDVQIQIVKYIEEKIKKMDIAISKAEEEIKLVKEYLESLIFNVVTGQVKVEEDFETK